MSLQARPRPDLAADTREAARPAPREDLELPRPWRLILTAGWNLAESLGLPAAGYLAGAALAGQAAGMVAATGVVWLTVAVRKVAARIQFPLANLVLCVLFARTERTRAPLVAQLAAEVAGLRQPSSRPRGLDRFFQEATWLWAAIFAAAGLAAALAVAPATVGLLLATAVTVGGVAAGAFVSALWFIRVLRRFGLHVRFAQA